MQSVAEESHWAPQSDYQPKAVLPTLALPSIQSRYQATLAYTPDKKYLIGRQLGEGGHGTVHLATEVATGDKVAIKVVSVQNIKIAAVECTTQGSMSHPNIVSLRETLVDLDGHRIFLVMELCRGGDLFDLIAETGRLDEPTARSYFWQMASALAECHASGVYHRDLKPENLLLDGDGNVKIADFGLARMAGDASHMSNTMCGTLPYAAPEVLTPDESAQHSAASADVWSLGLVLFIMLTGKQPFKVAIAERCAAYAGYVKHGIGSLDSSTELFGATELLQGMLNPNPEERLSMSEVFECTWLKDVRPSVNNVSKWCEVLGYEGASSPASTRYPSNWSQSDGESKDKSEMSATSQFTKTSSLQLTSPRPNGDTANDMLVRTLGWVEMPARQEKVIQQVTDVLDSLGVEYSVSQGELSNVVKAQIPDENCDDAPFGGASAASCSHMAGQLSVQMEIVATKSSRTDFHVKRHTGSVLRFHSFYHDLRNQLAGPNGWEEKAGRYLRTPAA